MKKLLALCLSCVLLVSGFVISVNAEPTIVSVSPSPLEEGFTVKPGEFKITFDSNVDAETLSDITFKKTGGGDIIGGAYAEIDGTDPKVVKVKYGALENETSYTLDVCGTEYEYTANEYMYYEDFSGYTAGAQLPVNGVIRYPQDDSPALVSGKATAPVESHFIVQDGADKFVRLSTELVTSSANAGGRLDLMFPEYIKEEKFELNYVIRAATDEDKRAVSSHALVTYFGDSATKRVFGGFLPADDYRKSDYGPTTGGSTSARHTYSGADAFETKDANGFYDLTASFERRADNTYQIIIKNNLSDKEDPMITTTLDGYPDGIRGFWITQFYAESKAYEKKLYLDLSLVTIKPSWNTNVLHTDLKGKTIDVVFTDKVDPETLNKVVMKNKANEVVEMEYASDSYSDNTRKATFNVNEILGFGEDYTLSFEGVLDAKGNALGSASAEVTITSPDADYVVAAPVVTDGSGTPIVNNEIGEAAQITVATTVTAEVGDKITLMLAIFDSAGRLCKIVQDTQTVPAGGSVSLSKATPAEIDLSEGYKVKPLIWNNDETAGAIFMSAPAELQ